MSLSFLGVFFEASLYTTIISEAGILITWREHAEPSLRINLLVLILGCKCRLILDIKVVWIFSFNHDATDYGLRSQIIVILLVMSNLAVVLLQRLLWVMSWFLRLLWVDCIWLVQLTEASLGRVSCLQMLLLLLLVSLVVIESCLNLVYSILLRDVSWASYDSSSGVV